jgi:23S rRNA pseudouridine2605 synthase
MQQRLQKILSQAGIASRRTAEALITQSRVMVNGKTVTALGTKADLEADDIRVDGRRVKPQQHRRYILLYKPRGYITTRSDPQRRPTVIDLLSRGGVREYVYPVGRLDYDSEGLLLLTSDGDLAAKLTHPRHGIDREYHVRVRGVPDDHEIGRLEKGLMLDGRRTAPATVTLEKIIDAESGQQAVLSFVIREGRNRQVRDMCDAIGHPVVRLERTRIGPIVDPRIRPGEFRDLDPKEIDRLQRAAEGEYVAAPPKPKAKAATTPRSRGESKSARGSRVAGRTQPAAAARRRRGAPGRRSR